MVLLASLRPAFCPDIVEGQLGEFDVQMAFRGRALPGGLEYDFRSLPTEGSKVEVKADTALLKNGDRVSGVIEGISEGRMVVRAESLPAAMRIPMENVSRIVFRDREGDDFEGEAAAIFVNGDCLRVNLKGFDGEWALVETSFREEVRIRREHLAAIVFRRKPRIAYEADFSSGNACGFESAGNTWTVADGALRAPGSRDGGRGAYLRLRQEGHLKYTWRVSAGGRRSLHAALYVFAQIPDAYQPGNAYHVLISGTGLNLYRTARNNSQHVASLRLSSNKRSRLLELDYDPARGIARISVDGKEAIAGQFGSPIVSGEYLILHSQGGGGFEHIAVRRVTDPVLSTFEGKADTEDFAFLMKGDRLTGEVLGIWEGKVRIETDYSSEPLEVSVNEISSLRFGRVKESEAGDLARVCLRNGDGISGEVVRLEDGRLRVTSPYLSHAEVDVEEVEAVVFPGGFDALDAEGGEEVGSGPQEAWPLEVIRSGRRVPVVVH